MLRRIGFLGALALGIALLGSVGSSWANTCPPQFNLPAGTVCDFNGEICRGGTEVIDGHTFCLMLGRLGQNEALEMDDVFNNQPVQGDANSVADANVFPGPCPALPCNDPDLPAVAGATYIDWNDLRFDAATRPHGLINTLLLNLLPTGRPIGSVEDHRIVDFTANEDYSIFSSGASCVTEGSSVPKEDFTQSYLANNDQYLYFAQERRTNSGNSVYYWMLNQEPPNIVQNGNCGANTRGEFQFTLKTDDLQVIANFPSSSDPASGTVFLRRYSGPTVTLPADDAVFAAGWAIVPNAIKNFALTIVSSRTPDADDKIPAWGGFDSQGKAFAQTGTATYEQGSMAEWAVDLTGIFSGQGICGQRLFLTGVSRSATGQTGDPTEPADLKDLVGPKLYSFGSVEATADLTPLCDPTVSLDYKFNFSASATDIGGGSIPSSDLSCTWTCTSDTCADPTLAYGNDASHCSGTGTIPRASGAPNAGPCDVSCSVQVDQTSSQCSDDAAADDDVLAPILVSIAANPNAQSCANESGIGDGITYASTVSGGDLDYSYAWNVNGPSAACGNTASCNVDFNDADYCATTTLYLTVDDGSICPAKQSESEQVTKVTSISATNN